MSDPGDTHYQGLNDWLAGPDTCAPPDEELLPPPSDDDDLDSEEAEFYPDAYANLQRLLNEPDDPLNGLLKAHHSVLGIHCGSQLRTPRP